MAREKAGETWPKITQEERTLYEILFYSQGPLDGHLLGEDVTDLLLQSRLPLTVLSKIWSLADISNDNVLNVHEFVLVMHLIRGAISGRPVPATLPRNLTPPNTTQIKLPPMTQTERDAYQRLFQTLEVKGLGVVDSHTIVEMFLATHLPLDTLALIWDLSDFGRDGQLNSEEFAIACHLLRYTKQGGSLNGSVDIFQYAPNCVSPLSLLARKQRVSEYEEHKQRLMLLKEKRRIQASQEGRRLDLAKERVDCLQELFELFKKHGNEAEAEKLLGETILKDKVDKDKQEEIVIRLKKVHEEVRQETVKIILGEQKFKDDICRIKKDTDKLNKRLLSIYTHENREADPFLQLLEQRKEMNLSLTIPDLDKVNVYTPFKFSPFDLTVTPDTLPSGYKIIDGRNNNRKSEGVVKSVLADLREFGEEFLNVWGGNDSPSKNKMEEFEEDEIFREVLDWSENNWSEFDKTPHDGLLGLRDTQVVQLRQKLSDLSGKLKTLNSEGGRLIFRNSDDYSTRKKSLTKESADDDRARRQLGTERLRNKSAGGMRAATNRHSYSGEMKVSSGKEDMYQAAREYRLQRQSSDFDSLLSHNVHKTSQKERKLLRSSTDPMSFYDQTIVPKEGSSTSVDTICSPPEKLQDRSSLIRKQNSSRTDDSGILTLRSSRRKDDLSLQLASIALGRTIYVETIPAPVSSERTKKLDLETNVKQEGEINDTSSTCQETEKQKYKLSTSMSAENTEETVVMMSNSPKTISASNKASTAPSHSETLHDSSSVHRSRPMENEKKMYPARFSNEEDCVLNKETKVNPNVMLNTRTENKKNPHMNKDTSHGKTTKLVTGDSSEIKRTEKLHQFAADMNNSRQKKGNTNNDQNSDEENPPPPLPISFPPLIPSKSPSGTADFHTKQEENGNTAEYIDPSRRRTHSKDVNQVTDFIRPSHSKESSKTPSDPPAALHLSLPTSQLPTKIHKNYEATKERISPTTAHRRSDYTDPTSSNDKYFNNQSITGSPGFHDILTDPMADRRYYSDISVNLANSENSGSPDIGQEDNCLSPDSVQVGGKSPRSSNPGDYGFVYSAERPKPPPEAGWRDKQGDDQKISLYSENVIKEGDTTDSVDRESIANLNTTKQQWEVLFTSQNSSHEESSAKKKVAPKWEVKIPYTEKQAGISTDYNSGETSHGDTEDPEMFKKHVDTESAIEREIRLAHEREDILIKEKEDRKKQTDKQKGQGQAIIASYEAESESFHQVYNELAEADRGSDLWSGEHGRRHAEGDNDSDENNEKAYPNESIIEKEIRLQRERESEISRMRKQALPAPHQHIQQQQQQQPQEKHPPTPTAHNTKHEVLFVLFI